MAIVIAMPQTPAQLEAQRRYRARHKDRLAAERQARYRDDPEWAQRRRDAVASWNARNPGYWRLRAYGLSEADHEALRLFQGDRCAVCWRDWRLFPKGLSTDHDHGTLEVRGLLCPRCNTDLEVLETPGRADALSAYLRSPPWR